MRTNRAYTHIHPPQPGDLQRYAARHHITLSDDQAAKLAPVTAALLLDFDTLDELPEPAAPGPARRQDCGRPPTSNEDPLNAFVRLCRVDGAPDGSLAGKAAAIKDSIAVAGISQRHTAYINCRSL